MGEDIKLKEENEGLKEEDTVTNDLQDNLQIEHYEGKYLTKQEILLFELYRSLQANGSTIGSVLGAKGQISVNTSSSDGSTYSTSISPRTTVGMQQTNATQGNTPKRGITSDRERVQNFLAQRQSGGTPKSGTCAGTIGGGVSSGGAYGDGGTVKPMSALERAKSFMLKKSATASNKPLNRSNSMGPTKRVNPLTDILKVASGSVVGSAQPSVKRPRTKSDKPGEIRLAHGRGSIQLPLESFLRSEDWDSESNVPLEIVLPEAAFATNNTLIIHATMPIKAHKCSFNISTQSSMQSGAPYLGTVLYHFNLRRQRGGKIIQNSNIDGRWGCSQPLPRCNVAFGEPFTLRLTMIPSGFLVFMEEIYQDEFKHRVPIREGENLVLTVPTTDENGNLEGVIVHNVWWGHAAIPPNLEQLRNRGSGGGISGVSGGGYGNGPNRGYHRQESGGDSADRRGGPPGGYRGMPNPCEVYVGNLPPGTSREELASQFQYLGYESVRITQRGFGFVTLRSPEDVERAVSELDGKIMNGSRLKVSHAK